MDPFYLKVEEIKKNIAEKNYETALDLYHGLTETFTEPYHEYEIKRLNLDKLMGGVSKKYFKLKLDENITLCQDMIENNNINQAKYHLNEAQKIIHDSKDSFILKQRIKIKKLKKEIGIIDEPLEIYPEPALEEFVDAQSPQKTIPEFDNIYFKEISRFIDGTLKQNGYYRIKIIPESAILENIYSSFDHLYYKIHRDCVEEPALISLVFLKIESSKGNIKLRYPEVDYSPQGKLNNRERNLILNKVVHFPIRIFKHLLSSMRQNDYETFRITSEIFEDLFVKVFPRAKILQHPLRVKNGANLMEIDAHGIIVLKKSLYLDSLPGLRSDHIYFLTQDNIKNFIEFQDKKYNAYISAKKESIENYEQPKQKHVFFGRQAKIGFIITPLLFLSALFSFLYQDLLTYFLIFDSVLILLAIGHGIFQRIFGESELYRISRWCVLSRDIKKWERVFGFILNEETVDMISAECSNFNESKRLRDPKKFSIPFLHNFSLRMFLKRRKLQKCYINPATTKLKTKSREVSRKIKKQTNRITSGITTKFSSFSITKPRMRIKRQREKVKPIKLISNKPKVQIVRNLKSISTKPRNSVKLTSINSFMED